MSGFSLCLGLAMFLAAAAAYRLHRRSNGVLPWLWLVAFAAAQGAGLCLGWAAGAWDSAAAAAGGLVATTVSWIALVEFGRRGLRRGERRPIGWWIHLPLLAAALVAACFAGWSGADRAGRYAIGLPGIVLAGLAVWRAARSSRGESEIRRVRRWAAPAGLVLLIVLGWITVPRRPESAATEMLVASLEAADGPRGEREATAIALVASGPPAWESLASQRLRWGIPLLVAVLAGAGIALAACQQTSRRRPSRAGPSGPGPAGPVPPNR